MKLIDSHSCALTEQDPLVSVIISTHNAASTITAAIESVWAQTCGQLDIVVIDDASTDETASMVLPYVRKGQARFIRHGRHKGLAATRNTGLQHSKGQVIAFLDTQDLWLPWHLEMALEVLKYQKEIDGVFLNADIVDATSGRIMDQWFNKHRQDMSMLQTKALENGARRIMAGMIDVLLRNNIVRLPSMVVRRQVCERVAFDPSLEHFEDLDWTLRVCHDLQARLALHPTVTTVHHITPSPQKDVSEEQEEHILRSKISLFSHCLKNMRLNMANQRHVKQQLLEQNLLLSDHLRERQDHGGAWHSLIRSLNYGKNAAQIKEMVKLLNATSRSLLRPDRVHAA